MLNTLKNSARNSISSIETAFISEKSKIVVWRTSHDASPGVTALVERMGESRRTEHSLDRNTNLEGYTTSQHFHI
jgi:hypothetical protein